MNIDEERRPDPDALLAKTRQKGKLRLFFGASAGVGKTYFSCCRRLSVCGPRGWTCWSASSRRTAALLIGLSVLPMRHQLYVAIVWPRSLIWMACWHHPADRSGR